MIQSRVWAVSVAVAVFMGLAGGPPVEAGETWKIASASPIGDRQDVAQQKFAELVTQRLGGRVTVNSFAGSQLGSEREVIEGVKLGTIEMGMTSSSAMTTFVPQAALYDLPFLFRDLAHARKVAMGSVGDKVLKAMEPSGLKGLATAESGFRLLMQNRVEVRHPRDMVGLKYRVIESPTHIAAFRALGASAVPIPFGEVYGALQQKVVDGMDLPLGNIASAKLHEVVKILSMTEHIYTPHIFYVNLKLWNSLSPADQKVLHDSAREASDLERKLNDDLVPKWTAELQALGMKIIPIPDKSPFIERMKPVWTQFEKQIGKDLIEEAVSTK